MKGKTLRGIVPIMAIGLVVMAALGIGGGAVAFDEFQGNTTYPDDGLYALEWAGETIRCAVSLDMEQCNNALAQERLLEAQYLQDKIGQTEDLDEKDRLNDLIAVTLDRAEQYGG